MKPEKGCLKKVMKGLFSHIGLCGMVVLYSVAGGFIFEHLEKVNEQRVCFDSRDEYRSMHRMVLQKMVSLVQEQGTSGEVLTQLNTILKTFRDNALAIGYDGTECDKYFQAGGPTPKWSWAGALMFSVTVISTIGYGHVSPKTYWGRLVCIAYAMLGIPLMLLCLANIGDVLADIFRFVYVKICCCGCCRKKKTKVMEIKQKQVQDDPLFSENKSKILTSAPPLQTELDSASFKPKIEKMDLKDEKKLLRPSTPVSSETLKIVPLDIKAFKTKGSVDDQLPRAEPMIIDDDSDDDDDEDEDMKRVTVPLTITMVVIAVYIFGGAALFGLWEGWDLLQSAYFCFITLSTIGFGDVVPGTDFESTQIQAQLIIGSIYVVFGMAVLSMCFTLMQDEIVTKFKWVGQKLGIIDKDDD